MSIRPIDMQLAVPKTVDYSKQHQGELNKQGLDQQMFAQTVAKETERKQTAVIETNESEQARIKDKQEKNGRQGKKNNQKHSQGDSDDDENNKKSQQAAVGLFDVRI